MKKFMMFTLIAVFSVAVLCAGGVKKAEALSISIAGGAAIVDNSVGDLDTILGSMLVMDNSVPGWTVVVGIASSKPSIGSATHPLMHLTMNATSTGAGAVSVAISDNGFTNTTTGFTFSYGGVLSGSGTPSASLTAWLDDSNVLFGSATPLGSLASFGSGAFSGSGSSPVTALGPFYSLTLEGTITHTAAGVSSLDASIITPEPGTIALLGIGLAGLVGVGVRRRMKTRKQAG